MRRFLAVLLVLFSSIASADDGKLALARQFVAVSHITEAYKEVEKTCEGGDHGGYAKDAYRQSAGQFGGISPQSAYWSEVEELYTNYWAASCGVYTSDKLAEQFAVAYADALTMEDLQRAVDFYSSPAGQRIQAGNMRASIAVATKMQEAMGDIVKVASLEFNHALALLAAKYKADPR